MHDISITYSNLQLPLLLPIRYNAKWTRTKGSSLCHYSLYVHIKNARRKFWISVNVLRRKECRNKISFKRSLTNGVQPVIFKNVNYHSIWDIRAFSLLLLGIIFEFIAMSGLMLVSRKRHPYSYESFKGFQLIFTSILSTLYSNIPYISINN